MATKTKSTRRERLLEAWHGPMSICTCGHLGDVPLKTDADGHVLPPTEFSPHTGINGHGQCCYRGCRCTQFTFAKWVPEFAKIVKRED